MEQFRVLRVWTQKAPGEVLLMSLKKCDRLKSWQL
jgi:hypothetical protein